MPNKPGNVPPSLQALPVVQPLPENLEYPADLVFCQSGIGIKTCGQVPTPAPQEIIEKSLQTQTDGAGTIKFSACRTLRNTGSQKADGLTTTLVSPCHSYQSRVAANRIFAVRLRTYIVEDNPTIRENLIGTLEELASVVAVGTAETENDGKAWLNANRQAWDLAIVDLFLKQGSGLGVLAACQDRSIKQKMVVLSNYATDDIRQRCAQLGVDAVFDKSNEIDALVSYCLLQNKIFVKDHKTLS